MRVSASEEQLSTNSPDKCMAMKPWRSLQRRAVHAREEDKKKIEKWTTCPTLARRPQQASHRSTTANSIKAADKHVTNEKNSGKRIFVYDLTRRRSKKMHSW